jgi:hypothetical protein
MLPFIKYDLVELVFQLNSVTICLVESNSMKVALSMLQHKGRGMYKLEWPCWYMLGLRYDLVKWKDQRGWEMCIYLI